MNRGRETEDGRRKIGRRQSLYESDPLADQYLLFHYGMAEDQLPYAFGPVNALFYPIRCVTEFGAEIGTVERALDLGCAVGRSTFELARIARTVIGIDLSQRFIAAARQIKQTGCYPPDRRGRNINRDPARTAKGDRSREVFV
jgi:SAM-dependent methyltransferase